ncbi:MAG: hypothetical protein II981_07670 [Bacteroidales bacterium]|nr:hypothetical protein [Bacteroidales bacterium]MBQ3595270.1 hypothetical protein [Bacteroidales bacterium]
MRKSLFLVLVVIMFGMTSCSLHDGLTHNLNQNSTNVVLQDNNYTIVQKVRGESQADYFFYFGGFRKKGLIEEARADMLENANLIGSSKAVINETVETSYTTFCGIYSNVKVTVSGYVVEFKE